MKFEWSANPSKAKNSPIPTATPYLNCTGIALIISVRISKTDNSTKITPDQNTAPNAT